MAHRAASWNGARWVFRRRSSSNSSPLEVLLALHQAPLEDFEGDYLVTSTNRALEGVHRKHWWGFAGRRGADEALHKVYTKSNHLAQAARHELQTKLELTSSHKKRPQMLPFADCLMTNAGPLLPKIGTIVHTCVPKYPGDGFFGNDEYLHTTLPHAWVGNSEEATSWLKKCYANVFLSILQSHQEASSSRDDDDWWSRIRTNSLFGATSPAKKELSIGLPAIGCGFNRYPAQTSANLALDAICDMDLRKFGDTTIRCDKIMVEFRFRETPTMNIWLEEVRKRSSQFRSIDNSPQ